MKKIFLTAVFLFGIAGFLIWTVHDTRVLAGIARIVAERIWPSVRIRELLIAQQTFSLPPKIRLQDVSCSVDISGRYISLKAVHVEIAGLLSFLSSRKDVRIHVSGLEIGSSLGGIRGLRGQFQVVSAESRALSVSGPVWAEEIIWDRFKAGETSFYWHGSPESLEFKDIRSEAYGGILSGQVRVLLVPFSYIAQMKGNGLQTSRLGAIHEQIDAQLSGLISATVHLEGDAVRPKMIEADIRLPAGGRINAGLLANLIQYLPQSRERKKLDILVRNSGKLAVEVFSFTIKSQTAEHLSGEIGLASKEANMQLNVTHDILTDGTWNNLLQSGFGIF